MAGLWLSDVRSSVDISIWRLWAMWLFARLRASVIDFGQAGHSLISKGLIGEFDFENAASGSTKKGARRLGPQTDGGDCEKAQYV